MAILILKHNALTPYADFEGAKNGIIEKMESAQQGELWAAEYFTASGEGVEETKGVILAFKGKNGIVTFTDGNKMSEEMKKELSEYYTKDEVDELLNSKLADYYTKDEVDAAIDSVVKSAIGVVGGDGIVIGGEGTEKTISTNVELEIKTIEGKEMIQLLDATDNSKVLAEVDASKFVVDGMLDSASIVTINDETELTEGVELPNGKYIKLTWNTDAGKSDTYVAVADLISEHKVVAGEDVAGEMVIVATNVSESTDENGIKVSTVNVSVNDAAVKTAFDGKIGKEDGMLSTLGQFEKTETVSFVQWDNYRITGLLGDWEILLDDGGSAGYGGNSIGISDPNRDGAQMSASSNYGTKVKFVSSNGIITAYGYQDGMGDYMEQGTLTVSNSGLYDLLFNSQKGFNGTITISGNGETYLNTKNSLIHLDETKADKSEVETAVAELETSLDTKIGKDDVMLSLGVTESTYSLNVMGSNVFTPYVSGNNWKITVTGRDSSYFLSKEGQPQFMSFGSTAETPTWIYTHNNGTLTVESDNQPSIYQIDPNASYRISHEYGSTIEVVIESSSELNTKDSLTHLNDIKANKSEVDNKVGKYDTVLSVNDGETKTDYNVEGALDYLKSEIEAMNVINCGVY